MLQTKQAKTNKPVQTGNLSHTIKKIVTDGDEGRGRSKNAISIVMSFLNGYYYCWDLLSGGLFKYEGRFSYQETMIWGHRFLFSVFRFFWACWTNQFYQLHLRALIIFKAWFHYFNIFLPRESTKRAFYFTEKVFFLFEIKVYEVIMLLCSSFLFSNLVSFYGNNHGKEKVHGTSYQSLFRFLMFRGFISVRIYGLVIFDALIQRGFYPSYLFEVATIFVALYLSSQLSFISCSRNVKDSCFWGSILSSFLLLLC